MFHIQTKNITFVTNYRNTTSVPANKAQGLMINSTNPKAI